MHGRVFEWISSLLSKGARFYGATHFKFRRASPMALSNLRCTGRHKLCQSQNVSAPLKATRLFWMFRLKKYGFDAFSKVQSLFQIIEDFCQDRAGRR